MPKKINMLSELRVACLGIIAIFLLEVIALLKGIDGTMFGFTTAGIGGIIGWIFKTIYKRK